MVALEGQSRITCSLYLSLGFIICSSSTSPGYITPYITPQAVVKMDPTSHCFISPSTVAPHPIIMTAAKTTTPHLLSDIPLNSDIAKAS